MLPGWLTWWFGVLTGDSWPAADEDLLVEVGRQWRVAGDELAELVGEVRAAGEAVLASGVLKGEAAAAMRRAVDSAQLKVRL
jgi:hypothetical protein